MKHGEIVYIDRYIDTSFGSRVESIDIAIMRTSWLGRKKIDKAILYGFKNDNLRVGDEVYYKFNGYTSEQYVVKRHKNV